MARREIPEINAGSMADIAFLLLIFFLVTTTMDTDQGILRKLSPYLPEDQTPPEVRERNIFVVLVNRDNQLLVEGEVMKVDNLKEKTIEFILNPENKTNLPEKKMKLIPILGELEVSKGVISLKSDRGTEYNMFIAVMNELSAALNEVKNNKSLQYFGKALKDLTKEQREAIDDAVPVIISEAEPNRI
ncbi:MAG: biopolymer transporter ExbD [Bacteroidales bacterium]|nr:biopolymer transporter ExbD [Bacteroidales bacterium]MBN2819161.1 biopolymer transporter ExbD [Bacteroidales bacterium]